MIIILFRLIFASLGFSMVYLSDTKLHMSGQSEEKIYKIGQAAKLVGLKSYVLRFWEGEFEQLEPIRTLSGQRLYNDAHIALISRIKALLHDEGLTIEGARKRLGLPDDDTGSSSEDLTQTVQVTEQASLPSYENCSANTVDKDVVRDIYSELKAIRKILG